MEPRSLQLLEFPKVLKVLSNFAVSSSGAQACLDLSPMREADTINSVSRFFRQGHNFSKETGFRLSIFPPLEGLFEFLIKPSNILDTDALFALVQTLGQARLLKEALSIAEKREWDCIVEFLEGIIWPEKTFSGLKRCIDPDGHIRDESSPELYDVRQSLRGLHQRCSKKVRDYIHGEDISRFMQDDFMTISSDRYVLPLKSNFKGRLQGIIHSYSNTGETCYFEPLFLVELNNTMQELKQKERLEELKVLTYLTGLVRAEHVECEAAYGFLVDYDVLQAKISFAESLGAVAVDVEAGAGFNFKGARHPLLVAADMGVHPLNIELPSEQRVLILSGGNAGGKTVCLKTVGLLAVMAFSGIPVTVDKGSILPLFKNIFVSIGDEQSLEENVSTFSAQIQSISRIWDSMDSSTLFILDEFGSGTDPAQGAALAQAVIDGLLENKVTCFAATHFPALKTYALVTEGVRAASVLFDPGTKKPLFRIAYDQVGASIALDVAREHGFPECLITKAEQYLLMEGSETGSVMSRLNELAVSRELELEELDREREKLRIKRAKLEERFEKERVAVLNDVKAQAQAVLKEWQDGKIGRKVALKKLADARGKIGGDSKPKVEAKAFSYDDIEVGTDILNINWDRKGIVLEKDDRKKRVKVDMDGVAMWMPADQLGPVKKDGQTFRPQISPVEASSHGDMALKVDLRGKRADIAISELGKFFDQALLRGATTIEVVHGRGTGALRREVHIFLDNNPTVASYALAPEDQGGDGMTLVELV
ncbi:DNA mismatch repair protein MutS2 [Maridesulfovibrio ferrireducens]|uniref:Endonuclease MutS2 n=1 Tax=Maridesulfovibrio ferrireducens TaxID=246191 RepID=A0A1G9HMN8_9BACT|nr:Smr/MutS family protein [Maridesulfovibrio ferrireducens]SDL14152.1 DNA mismatch repair protein MutS2 [Maridesulfovibrio ferrireducens]